jgi:peptidylamidoglycolate lyase
MGNPGRMPISFRPASRPLPLGATRLQLFDANGGFLHEWKGPQIGKPYGVGMGPNGHVFVIDGGSPSLKPAERGKAVELDASGTVIDTFGASGSGPGQFQLGHDIAIGPDEAVYVAEGTGARVQKFARQKRLVP